MRLTDVGKPGSIRGEEADTLTLTWPRCSRMSTFRSRTICSEPITSLANERARSAEPPLAWTTSRATSAASEMASAAL